MALREKKSCLISTLSTKTSPRELFQLIGTGRIGRPPCVSTANWEGFIVVVFSDKLIQIYRQIEESGDVERRAVLLYVQIYYVC